MYFLKSTAKSRLPINKQFCLRISFCVFLAFVYVFVASRGKAQTKQRIQVPPKLNRNLHVYDLNYTNDFLNKISKINSGSFIKQDCGQCAGSSEV